MAGAHKPDTVPITYPDVIVLDYLAALWAESEDLPPALRDELMSTVTEYIAMRRTAVAGPVTDPGQIVGRLGPPEALVAAARRGYLPQHLKLPVPADVTGASPGPAEYLSVALLTGGAFVLPVAGPFAGMLLASGSSRWTPAEKATAWVLTAGSAGAGAMLLLLAATTGTAAIGLILAFALVVCGPVIAGVQLGRGISGRPGPGR